jgi:hypothetical protein
VSLSLGGPRSAALNDAAADLTAAGITVVVAAGGWPGVAGGCTVAANAGGLSGVWRVVGGFGGRCRMCRVQRAGLSVPWPRFGREQGSMLSP